MIRNITSKTNQIPRHDHQPDQPSHTLAGSLTNIRSNAKFIIRYDEKQISAIRSQSKNNRYSSKGQYDQLRYKKVSEAVMGGSKGRQVPSYLRPTQSSISAKLQRNRIASMADMNNQGKAGSIIRMRSKSLQQEQNQVQKQYNRVPIEFYDQKNHGCGADCIRARVVYRGYAPKNTYYYLKTLKPFKRRPKKPKQNPLSTCSIGQDLLPQKSQMGLASQIPSISSIPSLSSLPSSSLGKNNEFDIKFQSKFQSGNLSAVARVSTFQYWIYMREDTNTHGLRQWYYFVAMNRKPVKVKFRIYKFTKSYSLYRQGMKPYIRTDPPNQWHQGGQKIKYEFDNVQKCYYLQFQYKFEEENIEVQFAMLPPYTYSMLKDYLKGLENFYGDGKQKDKQKLYVTGLSQEVRLYDQTEVLDKNQIKKMDRYLQTKPNNDQTTPKNPTKQYNSIQPKPPNQPNQNPIKISIQTLGQTLAGLDIPLIQLKKPHPHPHPQRQAIIILARTHPGQTVSNFAVQSLVDTILHEGEQIIQFFDFFIVPMVNPDGVYFGNHRTSVVGQDLNRNFHNVDFEMFPEIEAVQGLVSRVRRGYKIRYLIDLHGHSARKNIFAYGNQQQISSPPYLHTRILPKLLSDTISSFKYNYCIFKQSKQKKNTARVHFTTRHKLNCLTIEQSYGILEEGPMGVRVWRGFGEALARCLGQFGRIYRVGKEKALEEYLAEEIGREREEMERVIAKHKRMLGIIDEIANQEGSSLSKNVKEIDHKLEQKKNKSDGLILQHQYTKNNQKNNQNQLKDQNLQKQEYIVDNTNDYQNIKQYGQDQRKGDQNQKELQQQIVGQNQQQINQQEFDQENSVRVSQLSSGDQQLQLRQQQIQVIKKDIFKVGCLKQGLKRQKYNIADKKLQLYDYDYKHLPNESNSARTKDQPSSYPMHHRLHQQKSSMIPRIAKLQLKRKQEYNLSFKRDFRENQRDLLERERYERRMEIQAKFRRMELPSIGGRK